MSDDDCHFRVATGIAPDGVYVRIVADSGRWISSHPLTQVETASAAAAADADLVADWLREHPYDTVRTFIYDGDTGECLRTVVAHGLLSGQEL